MEAFGLFINILLGGVGFSNSLPLVLLQTFGSAFLTLRTLFAAMRRRSPLVKVVASLIPMVLAGTYIIAASIVFGAFFSSAWSSYDLLQLVEGTLNRDFVYELLGWVLAFFLLAAVFTLVYRLGPADFLLNFALELAAAVALLVLYGGLLFEDFPFTIVHLCYLNVELVRLPIYGLFAVIFKVFVLAVSLVIGGLLYEKPYVIPDEGEFWDRQSFWERQAQRYLTRDYLALGVSLLAFGLSVTALFGWIFWDEYGGWPDWVQLSGDEVFGTIALLFFMLLVIGYCLVGILLIWRRLLPGRARCCRRLAEIAREQSPAEECLVWELFYQEIVLPQMTRPEQNSWQLGPTRTVSEHFVIEKKGLSTKLSWRGGSL